MSSPTKRSPIASWLYHNALFAGALLLGFYSQSQFAQGMATAFAWVAGSLMALTLVPGIGHTVVESLAKEQRRQVPVIAVVAFDLVCAVVLAQGGFPLTATALTLAMVRSLALRSQVVARQRQNTMAA